MSEFVTVLEAVAAGAASVAGAAVAKRVARTVVRLVRAAVRLIREFRAFLKWRAAGGRP